MFDVMNMTHIHHSLFEVMNIFHMYRCLKKEKVCLIQFSFWKLKYVVVEMNVEEVKLYWLKWL